MSCGIIGVDRRGQDSMGTALEGQQHSRGGTDDDDVVALRPAGAQRLGNCICIMLQTRPALHREAGVDSGIQLWLHLAAGRAGGGGGTAEALEPH